MDNDLISRSALLKTIKERVRPDKYGTCNQVLNAMGTVIHAIRSQPAVCPENSQEEGQKERKMDNHGCAGI